jgi:hypothetical protein
MFRQFGVAVALSALVALYYFEVNFTSVWCFFAAVVSSLFFFYVEKKKSS